MEKFNYEKKNVATTLKNEIYGLGQLINILENFKKLNFSRLENKIVNVKLERFLKENLNTYISTGYKTINIIVNERYNQETKSYIGFYDRIEIEISIFKTITPAGKEQHRFDSVGTVANVENELLRLKEKIEKLQCELGEIDKIIKEYSELYERVQNFRNKRTSFFLDNFKNLRNFY